jgi:hypothetical protein
VRAIVREELCLGREGGLRFRQLEATTRLKQLKVSIICVPIPSDTGDITPRRLAQQIGTFVERDPPFCIFASEPIEEEQARLGR